MSAQKPLAGFITKLPIILGKISRGVVRSIVLLIQRTANAILNFLHAIVNLIVNIARKIWLFYCSIERKIVDVTTNILLAVWFIRPLIGIVLIGVGLAWFGWLWILLAYVIVILIALKLYYDTDSEDEDELKKEQKPLESIVKLVIKWTIRIVFSLASSFLTIWYFSSHNGSIFSKIQTGISINHIDNHTSSGAAQQQYSGIENVKHNNNANQPRTDTKIANKLKEWDGVQAQSPQFNIGDSFTYQTIDNSDPKLSNITNREVIDSESDKIVMKYVNMKSGYVRKITYDNNLNLLSTRNENGEGFDYTPSLQYFNFPLKLGGNWSTASEEKDSKTGQTRFHLLSGKVENIEDISVPAGKFKTFKIVIESMLSDNNGVISRGKDTSWYAPSVGRTIKSELESTDSGTGKTGVRSVTLLSFKLK